MVERQRLELGIGTSARRQKVIPRHEIANGCRLAVFEKANQYGPLDRRQRANDFGDSRAAVMVLSAI